MSIFSIGAPLPPSLPGPFLWSFLTVLLLRFLPSIPLPSLLCAPLIEAAAFSSMEEHTDTPPFADPLPLMRTGVPHLCLWILLGLGCSSFLSLSHPNFPDAQCAAPPVLRSWCGALNTPLTASILCGLRKFWKKKKELRSVDYRWTTFCCCPFHFSASVL
eukprot:RCo039844